MTILLTGAAGFIGFHVGEALLQRGERVVGCDSLDPYYDVGLKRARLASLQRHDRFAFALLDIADRGALAALASAHPDLDRIVHLAAQAGVRHSIAQPRAYTAANVTGQLEVLELARALPALRHLVYASSSSVYGGSAPPFAVDDACDAPQSLYAATKRAGELMTYTYSHLYGVPATALRFFTVYGPWGRPDMAPMLFARAILAGQPIRLFNGGDMRRDFTFVSDVVDGVLAALDRPPQGSPPHAIYNLGNNHPVDLREFLRALERSCGRTATIIEEPMQPGDVRSTSADITRSQHGLGYDPKMSIAEGVPLLVDWFRRYYRL